MKRWIECLDKTRSALAHHGYDVALPSRLKPAHDVSPYRPSFSLSAASRIAALVTADDLLVLTPRINADAGAEGFAIVASNGPSARHRFVIDYRFKADNFVSCGLGSIHGGYTAEFSRAAVVGKPVISEQRAIVQTAYRANLAIREGLWPGVLVSEPDAAARAGIRPHPLQVQTCHQQWDRRHATRAPDHQRPLRRRPPCRAHRAGNPGWV